MTTETLTLTDFLLARITEDEDVAARCFPQDWTHDGGWTVSAELPPEDWTGPYIVAEAPATRSAAELIARFDPSRVLAECAAKRAIVGLAVPFGWDDDGTPVGNSYVEAWWDALGALASVYADHPDYCAEWQAVT